MSSPEPNEEKSRAKLAARRLKTVLSTDRSESKG